MDPSLDTSIFNYVGNSGSFARPDEEHISDKNVEWAWDRRNKSDFVELQNNNREARFHQNFSSGTAVVRGTEPMMNDQHYWEVKMTSPVYGTDMMVGVGTSEADVSQVHDRFVSLLGMDNKTWGLSYTGLFHHSGQSRDYAPRFGQGSVIGVHLDMWNGTLSFYKNRKHLGVASSGLKGKTLFAMASSTAARSGMKITRSTSFPTSLQFLCCAKLRELIPEDQNVLEAIVIPPGLRLFLENNLSWLLNARCTDEQLSASNHFYKQNLFHDESYKIFSDLPAESGYSGEISGAGASNVPRSCQCCGSENGRYVMLGSSPFLLCNYSLFRRAILFDTRGRDPVSMRSIAPEPCIPPISMRSIAPEPSIPPMRYSSSEQNIPSEQNDDDRDITEGNAAKRRKFSYNYIMGLSDPDSD